MGGEKVDSETIVGPLFVNGSPKTFGDRRTEEPWKRQLSDAIKEECGTREPAKEKVQVDLNFRVHPPRDPDLDNLIKPCIDGVGNALFEQRKGGCSQWDTDDRWVWRITAEKVRVGSESDEGIEITVRKYPRL